MVDKPPFNNKKLRQAVAWAIDKRAILAVAYFGVRRGRLRGGAHRQPLVHQQRPLPRGPDLNKAQQLLHEAGYPNGLTIEYLGLPEYPELLKTGEIVKEQLAQIGITMNIMQLQVNPWSDRLVKKQYQITSAYQERTIDPDNFYSLLLTHDATPQLHRLQQRPPSMRWCKQAKATSDLAARKSIYAKVARRSCSTRCRTSSYTTRPSTTPCSPRCMASQVLPSLELRFKDVWLGYARCRAGVGSTG